MNKIKFKVFYAPNKMASKISDFMARCDLGIEAVGITKEFTIKTETELKPTYIKKVKEVITEAFENGGAKVHSITSEIINKK